MNDQSSRSLSMRKLTELETTAVTGGVAPLVAAAAQGFAAGVALGVIGKSAEQALTKAIETVKSFFK